MSRLGVGLLYSVFIFLVKECKSFLNLSMSSKCKMVAIFNELLDVDGFQSTQMKEMLHSSVEKFVGPMDSSKAYSTVKLVLPISFC